MFSKPSKLPLNAVKVTNTNQFMDEYLLDFALYMLRNSLTKEDYRDYEAFAENFVSDTYKIFYVLTIWLENEKVVMQQLAEESKKLDEVKDAKEQNVKAKVELNKQIAARHLLFDQASKILEAAGDFQCKSDEEKLAVRETFGRDLAVREYYGIKFQTGSKFFLQPIRNQESEDRFYELFSKYKNNDAEVHNQWNLLNVHEQKAVEKKLKFHLRDPLVRVMEACALLWEAKTSYRQYFRSYLMLSAAISDVEFVKLNPNHKISAYLSYSACHCHLGMDIDKATQYLKLAVKLLLENPDEKFVKKAQQQINEVEDMISARVAEDFGLRK